MGYCVSMSLSDIVIPAALVPDCLKAINALHDPQFMDKHSHAGSFSNGKRTHVCYSWVGDCPEGGWTELTKAFDEWRYGAKVNPNGDVEVEYFNGEKLGDDQLLWGAVAPFIRNPKAVIECVGEDDFHWKWVFRDGQCVEHAAKIVYEGDDD